MDGELIKRALCFHGKQMQNIWDNERGVGDLQAAGVPEDGNYSIHVERQKYFTFQDRAKRLKLHQFLARKAGDLYDKDIGRASAKPTKLEQGFDNKNSPMVATLPPFETYLTKHKDKIKRCALKSIKTGDIIYAQVVRRKLGSSILCVKPLCTHESNFKLLQDYAIKSNIPAQQGGPPTWNNQGTQQVFYTNDYVRCAVIDLSIDAERMALSFTPSTINKNIKLGKVCAAELPALYRKLAENATIVTYEGYLKQAKEIDNPNYDILYGINGLNVNDDFTLMSSLKQGFPQKAYAKELRQQQASKWAFRSVAEGIEYFKIGKHVEAFQCLNKALKVDPCNVEGLVARGALYAYTGLFVKAVEDFEKALKLNAFHVNARKYIGETLVALGRSYEEDNRIQDAAKAYRDCLNIIPKHDQAVVLLEAIKEKTDAVVDVSHSAPMDIQQCEATDHRNKLNALPSNGSSSEESSSISGSDYENRTSAKKNRDPSLSPLRKKMILHAQQMEATGGQQQFPQQFYMSSTNFAETSTQSHVIPPNELKLDEDDTESRVRKLLQDASNHYKDKKKTKKLKLFKKSDSLSKEPSKSNEYRYTMNAESTLNANLQKYKKSMQKTKERPQKFTEKRSTSYGNSTRKRHKSETPPPFALGSTNALANKFPPIGQRRPSTQSTVSHAAIMAQKFSFQIKKPVKIDKFSLVRLANPVRNKNSNTPSRKKKSRSRTRSRSKSRPRYSSRSRSAVRCSRRRSRSRSNSRERRRGRRSYSSSSSRSYSLATNHRRYDGLSLSRSGIRRTPSSFLPLDTPPPRSYKSRSRFPRSSFGWRDERGREGSGHPFKFDNRVSRNPNREESPDSSKKPSSSEDRWLHDKYENDEPTLDQKIDEFIATTREGRKYHQ